jgi:hypothetical protein
MKVATDVVIMVEALIILCSVNPSNVRKIFGIAVSRHVLR